MSEMRLGKNIVLVSKFRLVTNKYAYEQTHGRTFFFNIGHLSRYKITDTVIKILSSSWTVFYKNIY